MKQFYDSSSKYTKPINNVVKVVTIADHVQKCEAVNVARDPYYQHMPKDNAAQATIYAAKMGGEHHDGADY